QWEGAPAERRWTGTLGHIESGAAEAGLGSPDVIFVGRAIGEALAMGDAHAAPHANAQALADDAHAALLAAVRRRISHAA
ncbi:uroporphyrinogen-III C-methyltransferase, partial [Burkholderia pseudomallei]